MSSGMSSGIATQVGTLGQTMSQAIAMDPGDWRRWKGGEAKGPGDRGDQGVAGTGLVSSPGDEWRAHWRFPSGGWRICPLSSSPRTAGKSPMTSGSWAEYARSFAIRRGSLRQSPKGQSPVPEGPVASPSKVGPLPREGPSPFPPASFANVRRACRQWPEGIRRAVLRIRPDWPVQRSGSRSRPTVNSFLASCSTRC
jgi:hypothetical protein